MKMADTINELYSKYTEGVGYALEEDKYFQYLFEMIQAGDNTLEQKNRILHKVVDERWLTVVEEGIEAIFNIVDKPFYYNFRGSCAGCTCKENYVRQCSAFKPEYTVYYDK